MKRQSFKLIGAAVLALALTTGAPAGTTTRGSATAMPAYYDGKLFTIQFVEFSATSERQLLQHNGSLTFIYQSDPGLPAGQPFISVIDAIPTDGFNPIWEEVQITFINGTPPRQLLSDNEVADALNANPPQISLNFTGEVYWCPVVGQKP